MTTSLNPPHGEDRNDMIDPVLAERARAVYRARDTLFGLDASVEDVLVVADWLMTGRCELAMAFEAHRNRLYPRVMPTTAPEVEQ